MIWRLDGFFEASLVIRDDVTTSVLNRENDKGCQLRGIEQSGHPIMFTTPLTLFSPTFSWGSKTRSLSVDFISFSQLLENASILLTLVLMECFFVGLVNTAQLSVFSVWAQDWLIHYSLWAQTFILHCNQSIYQPINPTCYNRHPVPLKPTQLSKEPLLYIDLQV